MDFFTIVGYVLGVAGAITILFSKTKTDNLKDLAERVRILEEERKYAQEQHVSNQKAISNLEGQLKTYKEIPLQQIADSLAALAKNQDLVLRRLDTNAKIAKNEADTGGLLVKEK